MDPVHREVLDLHHSRLVTTLKANDVIDHLLREEVISKYDYDQLKRTEAQGSRAMNRLLLLTLQRRGGQAFPSLQRSLKESHQQELHDVLRVCELDILQGLVTDRLQPASLDRTVMSSPAVLNGHHKPATDVHGRLTSADSNRSESPNPVFQKPYSPAVKTPPDTDRHKSTQSPSLGTSSRSPSSKELAMERERQLKALETEVQQLRTSYDNMETLMKEQIEKLEKEREAGKKKEGGCTVM